MQPFFSIIIPIYNGLSHDLPICLSHIWSQPLDSDLYEVICIDDCSLDVLFCGCFLTNQQSKRVIEKCGFETAELTVVEGNNRAIHMYKTFGFMEVGRIPKANKYDDGTYAADIHMVKSLN